MRIVSDIIHRVLLQTHAQINTIGISGYHMMEAGADSVFQSAFTLAVGTTEEEIPPFLQEQGHPALSMDPIIAE